MLRLQKKVILITGAGGFIGTRAVDYFSSKGWKVKAVLHKDKLEKNPQVEYIIGDIRDKDFLDSALSGVNYIIHLAARKSDEPDSYSVNVLGSKNLANLAKKHKIQKIVNVSTASTRISKKGRYAITKSLADAELKNSGIDVITLRPSIIYGDFEGGIFGTLAEATSGSVIPLFGSANTIFWPIHMEDLMRAFEISLEKNLPDKDYDVGSLEEIKFKSLVNSISKVLWHKEAKFVNLPVWTGLLGAKILSFSKNPKISRSNVLGGAYTARLDTKKFVKDFKFKPRQFSQGLSDLNPEEWLFHREARILLEYIASLSDIKISKDLEEKFIKAQKSNGIWLSGNPRQIITSRFLPSLDLKTSKNKNSIFQKKLVLASAIVEVSPEGAGWLLPKNPRYLTQTAKASILIAKSFIFLPLVGGRNEV